MELTDTHTYIVGKVWVDGCIQSMFYHEEITPRGKFRHSLVGVGHFSVAPMVEVKAIPSVLLLKELARSERQ
jgi:hypothetical protein